MTTFTLVTWNANMAFHRKHHLLAGLMPDVAVVPECAADQHLRAQAPGFQPKCGHWTGGETREGLRKGLAVFSFGETTLEPIAVPFTDSHFLALDVKGPLPFTLIAVWPLLDRAGSYARPIQRTPMRWMTFFKGPPS
jgi:hypothetical protein